MHEEIEPERHCGNCRYYSPSTVEKQEGYGTCLFPVPAWLLAMYYKSRLVGIGFGHDCDCHKMKDV